MVLASFLSERRSCFSKRTIFLASARVTRCGLLGIANYYATGLLGLARKERPAVVAVMASQRGCEQNQISTAVADKAGSDSLRYHGVWGRIKLRARLPTSPATMIHCQLGFVQVSIGLTTVEAAVGVI